MGHREQVEHGRFRRCQWCVRHLRRIGSRGRASQGIGLRYQPHKHDGNCLQPIRREARTDERIDVDQGVRVTSCRSASRVQLLRASILSPSRLARQFPAGDNSEPDNVLRRSLRAIRGKLCRLRNPGSLFHGAEPRY